MTIAQKRKKVKKKATSVKKKKRVIAKKRAAKKRKVKAKKRKASAKRPRAIAKRPSAITRRRIEAKRYAVRSQASKKGWETRRENLKIRLDNQERLMEFAQEMKADLLGLPRPGQKKKRRKYPTKREGLMKAAVAQMMEDQMAKAQIEERIKEKMGNLFMPGEEWVETDESVIMQRLIAAEQLGVFDEEARINAEEFDWNLRDVYELWHSPDVYF